MFVVLSKRLISKWRRLGNSAYIIHNIPLIKSFSSSKNTSSASVKDEEQQSFTVSYLLNSCGLSLESAIRASKDVHFKTPNKPESVLSLLRDHGFSETQITKFIMKAPKLLTADPEKTLLPKLEFFRSVGFSSSDLAKMLSGNPAILTHSLDNHFKPWFNFFKSLLVDDTKVFKAMKNSHFRAILYNAQKNFPLNIAVLRQHGVPESYISFLLTKFPDIMSKNGEKFDKVVEDVLQNGFNPRRLEFRYALQVFAEMSKSTRERKLEVYKRCGLSEDDVQLAFKRYPLCVKFSEKKIMSMMDFYMNKTSCPPADIVSNPSILSFSLEKRVIPRCSVIRALQLKGVIKKDMKFTSFLLPNVKCFLDRFVIKYKQDIPQLLDVYQGKMNLVELGFGSEQISGTKRS